MSIALNSPDANRQAGRFDQPDGGLRSIGEILPLVVARYGIDLQRVLERLTREPAAATFALGRLTTTGVAAAAQTL